MNAGSMDMQAMMERIDKIHENHQQMMMKSWNSMTTEEQSEMYNKMQNMIEKMEFMNMQEHMNMMSSMGEKNQQEKCTADL